jgi:hypothetical protein
MLNWQQLVYLSDVELAQLDIALVNLACAQGLPGGEDIDVQRCIRAIDNAAQRVRRETERLAYCFRHDPASYENSWAYFRALVMVTVLQRDCGYHYDPELINADDATFFSRAEHLFLHGVIMGKGGTCSSLPPLFVAVGRRLGYPLKLVPAAGHLFARWDDGDGNRFNIECTARGFLSHSDDHYRRWPFPLPPEEEQRCAALRAMTPQQELAGFLSARGRCWQENKRWRDAVAAFATACELDPEHCELQPLVQAMTSWDRELHSQLMPGFPSITIQNPPRCYKVIPKDLEQGITHMIVKENILTREDLTQAWWAPLRRAQRPRGLPAHITVRYPRGAPAPPEIIVHEITPPEYWQTIPQPC